MPLMEDTLDQIVADQLTAGGLLAALKFARWCLANPDVVAGRPSTPFAFFQAMRIARGLIWDAIDDGASSNSSQDNADAVAESLGLIGVLELVNAIEHHRRTRSARADAIVQVVDRQLAGAIIRLTAAIADQAGDSN